MITMEELRQTIELAPSSESRLESARDAAIAQWRDLTGRFWSTQVGIIEDLTFPDRGLGIKTLYLAETPVTTLTSVEEKMFLDTVWTLVPATDYVLDAKLGEIYRHSAPADGRCRYLEQVRVIYPAGLADAAIPKDVKKALMVQTAFLLDRMSQEKANTKSLSVNRGSISYIADDFHPLFVSTAKNYTRNHARWT